MPPTSPLLHAPSLAQHRFIALMALWFAGSVAWGALRWWNESDHSPFLLWTVSGLFVSIQLLAQNLLLTRIKRWQARGWLKFFSAAAHDYVPIPRNAAWIPQRIIDWVAPGLAALMPPLWIAIFRSPF